MLKFVVLQYLVSIDLYVTLTSSYALAFRGCIHTHIMSVDS